MDSEKKTISDIYAISKAVHTVLTMCLPVMGISESMLPKIRVRMLIILKRERPIFRKMNADRIVFYMMMRAIKELRVPCRKEKTLEALRMFHHHLHLQEKRIVEDLGESVSAWRITAVDAESDDGQCEN